MRLRLSALIGLIVGQWIAPSLMSHDPEAVRRMCLRAEGATILGLTLIGLSLMLNYLEKKANDR